MDLSKATTLMLMCTNIFSQKLLQITETVSSMAIGRRVGCEVGCNPYYNRKYLHSFLL